MFAKDGGKNQAVIGRFSDVAGGGFVQGKAKTSQGVRESGSREVCELYQLPERIG